MNSADEWSPDEPLGAEANEPWDEALDAEERVANARLDADEDLG